MEGIKSCPHCGYRAEAFSLIRIPGYTRHTVSCLNKDCIAYTLNSQFRYKSEEEAIAAWNKRVTGQGVNVEAIEVLQSISKDVTFNQEEFYNKDLKELCQKEIDSLGLAISALEKVETLEAENARLREKETPKAIKQRAYNFRGEEVGVCPNNHKVQVYDNYCHICGQKLEWE